MNGTTVRLTEPSTAGCDTGSPCGRSKVARMVEGALRLLALVVPQSLLRAVGRWLLGGRRRRALRARLSHVTGVGQVVVRRGPLAGARLQVTGSNPGYALGVSEPAVLEALARYLSPGAIVLDVGANIGFLTLVASRLVGPTGHVYACEPLPSNVQLLRANLESNDVRNVTVVDVALGARSERRRLAVELAGDGPLRAALALPGETLGGPMVDVVTADALLASGRCATPDLVKIDVEGAEVEVLEGMQRLLTFRRPVIVCEIHEPSRDGPLWTRVRELLGHHSYSVTDLEAPGATGMAHVLALPSNHEGRPLAAPRAGTTDGGS